MSFSGEQNWWKQIGFRFEPKRIELWQPLTAFRAWGPPSMELGDGPGVYLSFDKPRTRKQAEGLFSVWEYGNTCRFVTEFEIFPGAIIFIGKVDPGDFYDNGLGRPGSQIYISRNDFNRFAHKRREKEDLIDDLGPIPIISRREPSEWDPRKWS